MLKWEIHEIVGNLFGRVPYKSINDFLNTLPPERALEAKILVVNTYAAIFYRKEKDV